MSNLDLENPVFLDVLKEINNIGAGNAISALSSMIDEKLSMEVPVLNIIEFKEIPNIIGDPEDYIVGSLSYLEGELNGVIMFLLDEASARFFCDVLLKPIGGNLHTDDIFFDDIEESALKEIGNIMFNAYAKSLNTLTNKTVKPCVPMLSTDMAGAILSVPAIEFGKYSDAVLFVETVFKSSSKEFTGYLVLIPDESTFDTIYNMFV